ncbi:hypothetical protein D3C87_1911500 [compost metagenome]
MAGDDSPAFDAGDHSGLIPYCCLFFHRPDEFGTDNAFVYEAIAFFKLSLRMPLRHTRRRARTAGRTVDGLVAVEHRIARCGGWV